MSVWEIERRNAWAAAQITAQRLDRVYQEGERTKAVQLVTELFQALDCHAAANGCSRNDLCPAHCIGSHVPVRLVASNDQLQEQKSEALSG